MKYLIIDGYSVNEPKKINIVGGRKLQNTYRSTHGKEVTTVIFPLDFCSINESCLGKVLNVEFNDSGNVVSAKVE